MSVTKFASLSPNSAGATIHIFPFDSAKYIPYLATLTGYLGCYPYNMLPLVVTEATERSKCQTQLLGY